MSAVPGRYTRLYERAGDHFDARDAGIGRHEQVRSRGTRTRDAAEPAAFTVTELVRGDQLGVGADDDGRSS